MRRVLQISFALAVCASPQAYAASDCGSGAEKAPGGCFTSDECTAGEYCAFPSGGGCGERTAGMCRVPASACTYNYLPVCGCDGQTYSNSCVASSAGVSVAYDAPCSQPKRECGDAVGWWCSDGEFCKFEEEDSCGAYGASGTCTALAVACPLIYSPVCGCDGLTYDNSCWANAASISVASQGPC
jgi:hypothetical protein